MSIKEECQINHSEKKGKDAGLFAPVSPLPSGSKVIHLKERSVHMLIKDLILRNPLRLLNGNEECQLHPGELGAVLARAGDGKTAFLIQLALNGLLREKKVLHISLDAPVNKVTLWYEEVFKNIAKQYQVPSVHEVWETILSHRLIMTFKVEGFSVPKLEERLTDLTSQKIFTPDLLIIDGLPFDDQHMEMIRDLKKLAQVDGFPIWFTVLTHRHDEMDEGGLPVKFAEAAGLFDAVIALQPSKDKIHVRAVKGTCDNQGGASLMLDPESLLIIDG